MSGPLPSGISVLDNFYARWRVESGVVPVLREESDSPPEYLLQAIWQHQRLKREQLRTLDGRRVQILHPGFRSVEGGPDFRAAVVQFDDEAPQSGDIEVDLRASGWRAHGHDRNAAFQNVILHVVWESERPAENGPPILLLSGLLDSRLGELSLWLSGESPEHLPEEWRGRCCRALSGLTEAQRAELLHQAALVRLQSKASQFQARARQAGWEQSLWEGLFRGLGYKHNVWPMQRMAELRPKWTTDTLLGLQARLLGLSGLLPAELTRTGSDTYLRQVWDHWWRERGSFADSVLPKSLWHLHGLRPANHPQRRLALASHWVAGGELPRKIEAWCGGEVPEKHAANSLLERLQGGPDEFWSWHCTFRAAPMKHAQPLLGAGRVTDLAVNVVLPWLWSRAIEGKNVRFKQVIERRYFSWPTAQDNSVLRLARERLLGGASARVLSDAAGQQGLMQIVRDFCEQSDAACNGCKLPELAKEFRAT